MGDESVRALELEWRRRGDVEVGARWLQARLRAGTLTRERLDWAAGLGHAAARRAAPAARHVSTLDDLVGATLEEDELVRVYVMAIDAAPAGTKPFFVLHYLRRWRAFMWDQERAAAVAARGGHDGDRDAGPVAALLDDVLMVVALRRPVAALALDETPAPAECCLTPDALAGALSKSRGRPVPPGDRLRGWLPSRRTGGWPGRFALVVVHGAQARDSDLCAWDGDVVIDLRDGDPARGLSRLLRAEARLTVADGPDLAFVVARVLLDVADDTHVIVSELRDLRYYEEGYQSPFDPDPTPPPPSGYEVDVAKVEAVGAGLAPPCLRLALTGATLEFCTLGDWSRLVGPRLMRHVVTLDARANVCLRSETLIDVAFSRVPATRGTPNRYPRPVSM